MTVPDFDRMFQWVQVVLSKKDVAANVKQPKCYDPSQLGGHVTHMSVRELSYTILGPFPVCDRLFGRVG
jgi:hypothetical protein